MYKFVAKDGGKYLTYEEAVNAKEKVSKWAETMQSSWETRDLVEQIQKISIPERVVIATGNFVSSIRWGLQYFQMPSTREVMEYDLSNIDGETITNGVQFTVCESGNNNWTDLGFYTEEITRKIHTGNYKK